LAHLPCPSSNLAAGPALVTARQYTQAPAVDKQFMIGRRVLPPAVRSPRRRWYSVMIRDRRLLSRRGATRSFYCDYMLVPGIEAIAQGGYKLKKQRKAAVEAKA
jgi:hypothetical protein